MKRRALSLVLALAAGLLSAVPGLGQDAPQIGQDGKDVEWVPTPPELIETMLDMADVTARDVVMDLGSGDGRAVIAAAVRGARAIGVEYDAGLVELSRARAASAGVADRAAFMSGDLFEVDLSPATVITMFLLPDINLKLRPTLLQLEPGTRLVSNTWDLGAWTPDETVVLDPCPTWCTSHLWIVPARVGGTWHSPHGELVLTQRFQTLSGTVRLHGERHDIRDGRLRGDTLSFHAGETRFQGRVTSSAIEGVAESPTGTDRWRATRTGL